MHIDLDPLCAGCYSCEQELSVYVERERMKRVDCGITNRNRPVAIDLLFRLMPGGWIS